MPTQIGVSRDTDIYSLEQLGVVDRHRRRLLDTLSNPERRNHLQ